LVPLDIPPIPPAQAKSEARQNIRNPKRKKNFPSFSIDRALINRSLDALAARVA